MRKRAYGEGSIRKRSNGTWEARGTVGVNPETGKLISKSVYGRTQKEVWEKLNALQSGEQQAVNPPAAGPGMATKVADEPEQKRNERRRMAGHMAEGISCRRKAGDKHSL